MPFPPRGVPRFLSAEIHPPGELVSVADLPAAQYRPATNELVIMNHVPASLQGTSCTTNLDEVEDAERVCPDGVDALDQRMMAQDQVG